MPPSDWARRMVNTLPDTHILLVWCWFNPLQVGVMQLGKDHKNENFELCSEACLPLTDRASWTPKYCSESHVLRNEIN